MRASCIAVEVNNLTDEPLRMYRDNEPKRIGRYAVFHLQRSERRCHHDR